MTEPRTRDGLIDQDAALRPEVEVLSQQFPDVNRTEIDERVHQRYDDLKRGATAHAHLIALTEGSVTEDPRQAAVQRADGADAAD
jgi:hypothetical protein